jgi:purine-binding chemotaxis protein CheW
MEFIKSQTKSLGELLLHAGKLSRDQLEEALIEQKTSGEPLGKILVRKGSVKEEDVIEALKGMLVVVFEVQGEKFGFEIVYSREILNNRKITPLPVMPAHILGMISIRNSVMPVISLNRMIFNTAEKQQEESKIIVIEFRDEIVGVMVDRILAVKNFKTGDFEDMRSSMIADEKKYIAGIIKDKGEIVTLMKPDFFFTVKIK